MLQNILVQAKLLLLFLLLLFVLCVFRIFWVKCCLGLDDAAAAAVAGGAAAGAAADVAALLFFGVGMKYQAICVCACHVCASVRVLLLLLFGSSFPFTRIFLPVLFAPGLAFFAYHHHPSKVCFCFLLGSSVVPPLYPQSRLWFCLRLPPLSPLRLLFVLLYFWCSKAHTSLLHPCPVLARLPSPPLPLISLSDHRATSLCALLPPPPSPSLCPLRTLSYINLKFLCLG